MGGIRTEKAWQGASPERAQLAGGLGDLGDADLRCEELSGAR
jgi:hypothetical protein